MTNDSVCLHTSKHRGPENLLLDDSCTCSPSFISITVAPWLLLRSGTLTLNCVTFNGGAFGQYGDRSHGHILQLVDGAALAPPAVRSNPQEMAHLIGPLGSIENTPARTFVANLQAWKCVCVSVRVCNRATLKQKARPVLRSWSGFTVAQPCSLSR